MMKRSSGMRWAWVTLPAQVASAVVVASARLASATTMLPVPELPPLAPPAPVVEEVLDGGRSCMRGSELVHAAASQANAQYVVVCNRRWFFIRALPRYAHEPLPDEVSFGPG
jgi:hypothetical protein